MANSRNIISPYQRFLKLFDIVKLFATSVGANVFRHDYRIGPMTVIVTLAVNSFFALNFYTVYVGVVKEKHYTVVMQSLCIVGTGIQGFSKLICAISNQGMMRYIASEIEFMYSEYENKSQRYVEQLNKAVKTLKSILLVIFKIYAILTIALISVPVYYYLILNQKMFIFELQLPGIDKNTILGFFLLQAFNALCVVLSGFGNFAADTAFFLMVAHTTLMKDILKCKFNDLDDILRQYSRDRTKTETTLRDIFQWHQRYLKFTETNTKIFFWIIFAQVTSSVMGIIGNTVSMFLGEWPVAPVYLVSSFIIMYCYCAMGNLVEISNDDVTTAIYDCLWYELTVPEQKMILIMLRESQKTESLSVGGIRPLTMNTGLQLTKTIYTVAMLLNESLN
ncbi:odorant receptor 67d [Stomoxys calcitrans]|uniref:Odorant receptor n=1 Tax=Stomoxys calcitrans TaxID=35570 RepID=A0A1I8PCA0_STOCA|nr:odorant receptor 67d [Stomoxys calcitrans]